MAYWYGFRQVMPRPAGEWVASGPYDNFDAALAAYDRAKLALDAQLSPPFLAGDRQEADRIARERG